VREASGFGVLGRHREVYDVPRGGVPSVCIRHRSWTPAAWEQAAPIAFEVFGRGSGSR